MSRLILLLLIGLLWGCASPAALVETPAVETATPTPRIGVTLATHAPPTAAVAQTTPTPLPTPTATPTPTPIVYVIESGDTLLAIAIEHRTTVAEIEALNPGIRPELLQIGQAVQLPPPATPLAQQAAATAVPMQVEVTQVQSYRTPVGSVWLLGEVVNNGSLPAENVQVEIRLLDESGAVAATAIARAATAVIPPGETAPFGALINEPPAGALQPVVSVIGGQSAVDLGSRYLDVTVVETAVDLDDDPVRVSGQVQNAGESVANGVILVATFYDNQGRITGYQQYTLPDSLAPGNVAAFAFSAAPPGGHPSAYAITAQATTTSDEP